MKRYSALIAVFLFFTSIFAMAEDYRLLPNERLTNNQINCITQDVRGFIWLGTDYGLNRFDGQTVTQYTRAYADSTSLSSNTVRCITPCTDGSLWVGLSTGMQRFCPRDDNFHNITFPKGVTPNVTSIVNLRSGDVAIGTSGYGIFIMKDNKKYVARAWDEVNDKTPCRYINHIFEDSQGRLWIGSHDSSAWVYDPSTKKTWRATPENESGEVSYICEDPSGRVIVVTHSRIFSCHRGSSVCEEEFQVAPGKDIISASLNGEGTLMIVLRREGIYRLDRQLHTATPYSPLGASAERLMRTLHIARVDRDGNLWMCSPTLGVAMMPAAGQAFSHYNRSDYDSDLDGLAFSIWPAVGGGVNVGYETGYMVTLDERGHVTSSRPTSAAVRSACWASDHRLWLGHFYGGISYIDGKTNNIVKTNYGNPTDCINAIAEDSEGRLWYAAFGHGFGYIDPATGEEKHYESSNKKIRFPNDWVNSLDVDHKGRVWLGHCERISCFDPATGQCLPLPEVDSLPFTFGHYVRVTHDGTVWVGTDNGIITISSDLHVLQHITSAQGLSNDNITSIQEDNAGRIWVSTMNGLNRITRGERPEIACFYAGNGLVDRQYTRCSYYDSETDRLYFGGTSGITVFSPTQLDNGRPVPNVRLMALLLNNQPASALTMSDGKQVMQVAVTEAEEFYLGYEDNSFTMEFGVTSFTATADIAYEYSFDGKQWNRTPPGQNRITFTHLGSGTYPLQVRALLGSDVSAIKQYIINISAPWYATAWAWIVYTLFFLAMVGAGVFVYLRNKQAELNESKLVFFTNISHEIRTPMTMIVSPLDKLLARTNMDSDTRRSLLVMRQNAGRILALMNQLLDIRKFDKGQMALSCRCTDVAGFLDGIVHLFDEQARQRNITFNYERPEGPVEAWIDQSHIDKVTMNLLGNAFKFTPDGGTITLRLETTDTHFTVSVTDTGIGLDDKDKEHIFQRFYRSQNANGQLGTGIGLHLSSELMRLHHGTLTADNRHDNIRGSVFAFTLPLGNDYLSESEMTQHPAAPETENAGDEKQSEQTEATAEDTANSNNPSPAGEGKGGSTPMAKGGVRVMIVDDDEEILSYLKGELQAHYRLILCRNGQEAINTALREQPAVIVSDVMMPIMDGCTMVKRLRSNANISHIPVILLSAKSEVEDRIAGLSQGADAYIAKPFHTDELLAMIRALIEGRQRLRGTYSGARDQEERIEAIEMQSSDEQLMDRLMKVVNQHLSDSEFNIEQLASEVGLSRTHLHRKLKVLTGLSASEFLRNLRMRQAEQLLKSKRMNISQIAYAVGFANQTHFSTAFKKYTGMSPSEYIEANMPEQE